jgi:hypothetical protein
MGERGRDDDMKQRKTSLEPLDPITEKAASQDPMSQDPMSQDSRVRTTTPKKPEARLGREVQARIGQQLRALYNDVVSQGVPQHLSDLVRRLGDQESE